MMTANLLLQAKDEPGTSDQLFEEVGTLVFQSALMYYLASHDDNDSGVFEEYISRNASSDTFMEDLCQEFPEFEQMLMAEMQAFAGEVRS